jgi:hypothetical protein
MHEPVMYAAAIVLHLLAPIAAAAAGLVEAHHTHTHSFLPGFPPTGPSKSPGPHRKRRTSVQRSAS